MMWLFVEKNEKEKKTHERNDVREVLSGQRGGKGER